MSKCICNSCKNLKSIISEKSNNKNEINEECEFGFPSDDCLACEEDGCELTCDNYIEDNEDEKFIILKCSKCNKEVKHVSNTNDQSQVFCVTCYLNQ